MVNRRLIFPVLFVVLGLIALQIPFSNLLGANVKFTLFDFFAPSVGMFLGIIPGIITILLAQIINIIFVHAPLTSATVLRMIPTLFALIYFSKKNKGNILIPILALFAFNMHPVGRSAWQYSLFWLIPLGTHFLRKNIFMKSLGATFTAHAVGGAIWVWTFGLTKQMWLALIPQTMMERLAMAGGIALSYVILRSLTISLSQSKYFSNLLKPSVLPSKS